MNKILVLLGAALLTACATGYNPRYYFNEIQVVNQTGATITDVSLRVVNSPQSVACEELAKFAMCADRFGKRIYPQQGLELAWTDAGGNRQTDSSNPGIPAYFAPAFPLRVVLEIKPEGIVEAFFEQEEPGRDGMFTLGLM